MSSQLFSLLSSSITESTIWSEDSDIRIVWITMLAMCDKKGRVWASIPGLARRAAVPLEKAEEALNKFLSPDPYSRTKDHDGRRIEEIDGGWQLLNHAKYRAIRDDDDRREYKAKKQREYRQKKSVNDGSVGNSVDKCGQCGHAWTPVDSGGPQWTDPDPDPDPDTDPDLKTLVSKSGSAPPPQPNLQPADAACRSAKEEYSPEFLEFWQRYPKREGSNPKHRAYKAWRARIREGVLPSHILDGISRYAAYCEVSGNTGTRFVMQAATFLGPDRHFDEPWQANLDAKMGIDALAQKYGLSPKVGESMDAWETRVRRHADAAVRRLN